MKDQSERIQLLHPDPDKSAPWIELWKYQAVKLAILLAFEADPTVKFMDLPNHVKASLSPEELENLGSVSWYTTTVKLDMEAHQIIERIPGSKPQALRLVSLTDVP